MRTDNEPLCEIDWNEKFISGADACQAGDFMLASERYLEAVDIAIRLGFDDLWTESILALAKAQRISGKTIESEQTLWRAIHKTQKRSKNDRVSYAQFLGTLGQFYHFDNRIDEASEFLEKASNILRELRHSSFDYRYLDYFIPLIFCYVNQDEFHKAEKLCKYTFDLCKKLVGPFDMATILVLALWSDCADALGKPGEGSKLRSRYVAILMDKPDEISDELGYALLIRNGLLEAC